ncbi:hypothetical protein CASFOL_019082 [Castilleja foliolosa]|uniref:Uncharacterized protein n=1 Tax=Castilleja foliolosa TaxID=1961234 RepID=A0ABD3D436_9LAMI
MAKMGFSPQTTPFRPSSFSPPYFWFCRSCTHFYSTSASSNRVLCRLEDRASNSANNFNTDLPKLSQRKNYSSFQNYDREIR